MGEEDTPTPGEGSGGEPPKKTDPEPGSGGAPVAKTDPAPATGAKPVSPADGGGGDEPDEDVLEVKATKFLEKRGKRVVASDADPAAGGEPQPDPDEQLLADMEKVQLPPGSEDWAYDKKIAYKAAKVGEMRGTATAQAVVDREVGPIKAIFANMAAQQEATNLSGELAKEFGGGDGADKVVLTALATKYGDNLPGMIASYREGKPLATTVLKDAAKLALLEQRKARIEGGQYEPPDDEPVGGGGGEGGYAMSDEDRAFADAVGARVEKLSGADARKGYDKKIRGR